MFDAALPIDEKAQVAPERKKSGEICGD